MSFFNELRRRNVFKVAAAYLIVGWLILQVGEVLAPALRLPDWVNSALVYFIILGFPLALIFAWAFELTPEGLRLEKKVNPNESITHVTGRKLNTSIIVLLVLALAYFVVDKFWIQPRLAGEPPATAGVQLKEHSIAVLPFADMSPEGDNEYFSDGLTEELLNILSRIGELQVAGRTSSFAFKGRNEDLRTIGAKLNVGTILEGSVRKDDRRNRVRITAQLVNATDGYHLWSEVYDRQLDDIFAIQEEIAHEVAKALRVTLLGEDQARLEQAPSTAVSVYDLYLQALGDIRAGGYVSLGRAVDRLQQVLTEDPAYAPARLALVNAWLQMANTGALSAQEAVRRGLPVLEALLADDPANSEAHVSLAILRIFQGEFEAANREFVTALELDPRNALALGEYGRFLFNGGETERGLELLQAALGREPYAVEVLWDLCQTNAYLQNLEAALAACARIADVEPDSPFVNYGPAQAYLWRGEYARGMEGYLRAIEQDPGDHEMLGAMSMFWTSLGDADQSRAWLQRAEAIGAGQPVPINARLQLHQFLEQHDLARKLVREALAQDLDARHGTPFHFRQINAFESLAFGEPEVALAPYREAHPWAFAADLEPPLEPREYTDDLIYIADLMMRSGLPSERSEQLLALFEANLDAFWPAQGVWQGDYRRAQLATLRGNPDAAVALLERAFERGWRGFWRQHLVYDPVLSRLRDNAAYQRLVARFEEDMERQRAEAHALLGVGP